MGMKFLKNCILIAICYCFLGMKEIERVSQFYFPFINFKSYTNELTSDGLKMVDSLAFRICLRMSQNKDIEIIIRPYHQKQEYEKNSYIGFDRYREFLRILKEKHQINVEESFYYQDKEYDRFYSNENRSGLYFHFSLK
jgi:hypothetical protein